MKRLLFTAIGVAVGAAGAYVIADRKNKQTETTIHNLEQENRILHSIVEKLKNNVSTLISDRDSNASKVEKLNTKYTELYEKLENICALHNISVSAFCKLLDPDMLADITDIDDIKYRDACLGAIENAALIISTNTSISATDKIDEEIKNSKIAKIMDTIEDMTNFINDVIIEYEEECDDEDDEDDDEEDEENGDDDICTDECDCIDVSDENSDECSIENSEMEETEVKQNQTMEEQDEMVIPEDFEEFEIGWDDNTFDFIINKIGYNENALRAFKPKLELLEKLIPEAGDAYKHAFIDIAVETYNLVRENKLTDDDIIRITSSIKALITNMKKNHGSLLKAHQND